MKVKDVESVSRALGSIITLMNDLIDSGKLDEDIWLKASLVRKKASLQGIKENIDNSTVKIKEAP